jgi:hypothetical protein
MNINTFFIYFKLDLGNSGNKYQNLNMGNLNNNHIGPFSMAHNGSNQKHNSFNMQGP